MIRPEQTIGPIPEGGISQQNILDMITGEKNNV